MDNLPAELLIHISQYLDNKSKINFRATNIYCRKSCPLDYFRVYGATSENLPRIVDTYSKIRTPISLVFRKSKNIKVSDFGDHLTKLTNLTSLELDQIANPKTFWREEDDPWMKLRTMTQLTIFKPYWSTNYPLSLLLHFTNLKEFTYTEIVQHYSERFEAKRQISLILPSLLNLESLELDLKYPVFNPFNLIATPSKITKLILSFTVHRNGDYVNTDSLKRFINLKKLKLDVNAAIFPSFVPGLEDLQLVVHNNDSECNFDNNTMLTRLYMKCQSMEDHFRSSLKHLTKMKKLEIELFYKNSQIRQDPTFEFLSAMTRLEHFKINALDALNGELFSFMNSTNLTTLQWTFGKSADISPLSKYGNLRVLVLTQQDKDSTVSYDQISTLTSLTCLKINGVSSTQSPTFLIGLTMLRILSINAKNGFGEDLDLSTLPNLESVDILGTTSIHALDTLSATNITRFVGPLQPGSDYNLLLAHPLLHLQVTNDNEEYLLWKTLEQMTSLKRLALFKVHHFKKLYHLVNLTNLKVLELTEHKKFPYSYFTKLTSLREVNCGKNTIYRRDE